MEHSSTKGRPNQGWEHIDPAQVKQLMDKTPVSIVDIRDSQAFAQGHIPHAKLVNDVNIKLFIKEADKQKPLICYCYHGFSSQNAASFFANQGFKKVYSVVGGYEQWKALYG